MLNLLVAVTVLFPFVPRVLDRDIQPIYLFALFILIAISGYRTMSNRVFILASTAALIIIYRARFGYDLYDQVRGLVFYMTPVLMIVYLRNITLAETEKLITIARLSLYLYVVFAAIQFAAIQFFGLDIFNLIDGARGTADRGVSSLCPEPSMLGFVLTSIAIFLVSSQRWKTLDLVVFVTGILMCGAASAILAAIPFLFGAVRELVSRSRHKTAYSTAIIGLLMTMVFAAGAVLPSRILELLSFRGDLTEFSDFSALERIGHVYFVFFQNSLLLGGAAPWGTAYLAFIGQNDIFRFGSDVNNILTSLGAVVYDGGILGFLLIYFLFRFSEARHLALHSKASIFLLAIQSMSFAVPVLWLAAFSGLIKKK